MITVSNKSQMLSYLKRLGFAGKGTLEQRQSNLNSVAVELEIRGGGVYPIGLHYIRPQHEIGIYTSAVMRYGIFAVRRKDDHFTTFTPRGLR